MNYHLDWLRFTTLDTTPMLMLAEIFPVVKPKIQKTGDAVRPLAHYNTAIELVSGRIDWHSDRPEQKVLWTFTGEDLAELTRLGVDHQHFIRWVLSIKHVNITRLDFAINIYGTCDPMEIVSAFDSGLCKTHAQTRSVVESKTGAQRRGLTVYIGSRQSTRLIRVYDKSAQQGTNEPWVRIEIEVKSPLANTIARAMRDSSIRQAGQYAIASFIETGVKWFDDAVQSEDMEAYKPVGRKETAHEKWVREVCLPEVIAALNDDDDIVWHGILATLSTIASSNSAG